jgi:GAF domain
MQGSAQPDDRILSAKAEDDSTPDGHLNIGHSNLEQSSSAQIPVQGVGQTAPQAKDRQSSSARAAKPAGDSSNGGRVLAESELDSALQLLVERAQYITGATGSALALPQGDEMVCRASAGLSAPAVGARLQVRSGLTGESISRRQLLRCDNAETDPRVNLETCRALGIASIVVLPLLRRSGEVRGLFELFSDHPYAFEERDLIALERMAALTLTALDLAEEREHAAPAPVARREMDKAAEAQAVKSDEIAGIPAVRDSALSPVEPQIASIDASQPMATASIASVPDAMMRVQKCSSCGFPVSDGRSLCLDCEKRDLDKKDALKKQRKAELTAVAQTPAGLQNPGQEQEKDGNGDSLEALTAFTSATSPQEFVPAFLADALPVKESWMSNHVNLLAVVVLILGILVAIVVFR